MPKKYKKEKITDPLLQSIAPKIDQAYKKVMQKKERDRRILQRMYSFATEGDPTAKEWLWENYKLKIIYHKT